MTLFNKIQMGKKTILSKRIFDKVLKILATIEVLNILEKDEGSLKPKSIELYLFFRRSKIIWAR